MHERKCQNYIYIYNTILLLHFQQFNTHRGKCQDKRASPLIIIQIHCSPSPLPTGLLALHSHSAGPLLGCVFADCAELPLRPLTVSGSADFPRGRRPQTEAVCRWLGSQRKSGGRWESTGRKATCRLVIQAGRGCHKRGEHDTWYERHLGVQMMFIEFDLGRKFLTYHRHQFWDRCSHVCTEKCWEKKKNLENGCAAAWRRIVVMLFGDLTTYKSQ